MGETVRVVVGRIGKAHGLRGEVSVDVRTDEPELRFAVGQKLHGLDPANRTLTVAGGRWHGGRLLVTFDEIDDRTAAELVRGSVLEADVDAFAKPDDPDEYFDRQLVGLTAVTTAGDMLGEVTEVMHLPGHDMLAVKTPGGEEVLVPFVEKIVPGVDLEAAQITVDPPEGLFP